MCINEGAILWRACYASPLPRAWGGASHGSEPRWRGEHGRLAPALLPMIPVFAKGAGERHATQVARGIDLK
jgi:hypothetical protein